MFTKLFSLINSIFDGLKGVLKTILDLVMPTIIILVGCDVIVGTKIGVLDRIVSLLSKIGISGNGVLVTACVIFVLWFSNKK